MKAKTREKVARFLVYFMVLIFILGLIPNVFR